MAESWPSLFPSLRRSGPLVLSLCLHAAVIGSIFLSVSTGTPVFPEPLVEVPVVLSEPKPSQAEARKAENEQPAPREAEAAPSEAAPGEAAGPGATPEGVAAISPVKSRFYKKDGTSIHVGRGELKGGAELTMTLRALADYQFTLNEYCGYYKVDGEKERFLNVVDGLKAYGRLILYDSKTGLSRTLAQFSKYIFTYGPDFKAEAPVVGSIMFLPRKPFEGSEHVDSRSRLLWQPDNPPAVIATMVAFREQSLDIRVNGRAVPNILIGPSGKGPYPAVIWLDGGCAAKERFVGFARAVALRGIAVLISDGPPCKDGLPDAAALAAQALAAAGVLVKDPAVDPKAVGVWGADAGGLAALAALGRSGAGPISFAVCAVLGRETAALPAQAFRRAAAPKGAPVLLAHAGELSGEWAELARRLGRAGALTDADISDQAGAGLGFGFNPGGAAETAMPWILERFGKNK